MTKTDDALVADVRAGSTPAFDELMRRYEKLVCKIALGYVREKQSALDVTQNVFLKVWKNLDSVTAEGMFKPWLLRITYNESINWIRKRKRTSDREDELVDDGQAPEDAGQEERMLLDEQQRKVVEGIAVMNPKYRMAVSLRYAEGLRVRQIADVMQCSEGMVKSLLFRGVRQIRQHVGDVVPGGE